MRILYHHRTQAKGAEGVHIREIVKALEGLGHEVIVVSPPGINIFLDESEIPKIADRNLFLRKIWSWISLKLPEIVFEIVELLYNFMAIKNLNKVIKTKKIDFIYERNAFFGWASTYVAKKNNIPIIIEVNELSGFERVRGQILTDIAQKIEKDCFVKADALIVVSRFLKERIASRSVDKDKIFVIPNAVNISNFNFSTPRDVNLVKRLDVQNKKVLGFVGGFVKWHNFEFLLDSLRMVLDESRKEVCLLLVGYGPLEKQIRDLVKTKGLDKNVIFTGKVPHNKLVDFIKIMDICIIPHSNEYRSPIKMFEYMAMGKPVLAPKSEPIESIIHDGENGVLFELENKNEFKNSILGLINDEHKSKCLGNKARETILNSHLWKHNAERILIIYQKLTRR